MPRPRRPPGAGPALSLLALFLLPSLLVAAQQQQPLANHHVKNAHLSTPQPPHPNHERGVNDAQKRQSYASLLAENERAVATHVSTAPAVKAVRAHPAAGNAASGVQVPRVRSLQDWEVEDFVLLATVDGHIHARDRYNGKEIWELAGKPMLETIYNTSDKASIAGQDFLWIVEPREDGALYILSPGPYPVLQSLGLTVKQLTESAPFSSDDPDLPFLYNVEKKTFMLLVDAASGVIKQSFSPGGSFTNDDRCTSDPKSYFSSRERDCRGVIDLGQTEYTVTIHNRITREHLCTIKYAEWNSNSRDKDLQSQYAETMDQQYIYSKYNGEVIAYDHKRPRWYQRPSFKQPLPYPVARVFDVARPTHDKSIEPPLVLLPQPVGPAFSEEMANRVLLNTTDSGAWYALSEISYPVVTDGAPEASCYSQDNLLGWDAPFSLPDPKTLIGVHKLDFRAEPPQSKLRGIAAPTYYLPDDGQVVSTPPKSSPMQKGDQVVTPNRQQTIMESRSFPRYWVASFLTFVLVATCFASYNQNNHLVKNYLSKWVQSDKQKQTSPVLASPLPAIPEVSKDVEKDDTDLQPEAVLNTPEKQVVEVVEEPFVDALVLQETKEKKVTFAVPDDEEDDISVLSRTTTADQSYPAENETETATTVPDGEPQALTISVGDSTQDQPAAPPTPKKKKTHRGKRGGRKLNRNSSKDEEEVARIVDAAKQLEVGPRLHPDEITMNGDDIQDVSNIKRIGKLTIDQDRLLGNGSGGTFVFEGKWNVSNLQYQIYVALTLV